MRRIATRRVIGTNPSPMSKIKLPLRTPALDGIPEAYHAAYTKDGDEFVLTNDIEVDDPVQLKTALQKERAARAEAERVAKRFGNIDLDEIEKLQKEREERERVEAERKGEYQKLLAKQREEYEKAVKAEKEAREAAETSLRTLVKKSAVTAAIAKADGNVALLTPHVLGAVDAVVGEDGEWQVVVTEKGKPKIGKTGDPMTVDEFVTSLREDPTYQPAFKAPGGSGGGTRSNGTGDTGAGSGSRRQIPKDIDPYNAGHIERLQEQANKEGITFVTKEGSVVVAPLKVG